MNPVVHFELPYEDRQRMVDFYAKAFGWQAIGIGQKIQIGGDQQPYSVPQTQGNKHLMINGSGGPGDMARVMALILAEKHAAAGGDVAGAVKRYNGAGPATEQYLAKVQAAKELLLHPRNAPLMQHFNATYLKR